MKTLFTRFRKNRKGATAIEYGLIAGAMAVVIAAVFASFGEDLIAQFEDVTDQIGENSDFEVNDPG